jgi:hypothetical protein
MSSFQRQNTNREEVGRWKHARHYSSLAYLQYHNSEQIFATFCLQQSLFQYVCVCVFCIKKTLTILDAKFKN